jgi:hypothetical protein
LTINHKTALFLRWAARILGTPLAVTILLDFLRDIPGPRPGAWLNLFRVQLAEQILLDIVLVSSLGLLLAWRHETPGGWIASTGGIAFLLACLIVPGMSGVWGLGAALAVPGLLYLLAAYESHAPPVAQTT